MVECLAHPLDVAVALHQVHGVDLAHTVRTHVLRQTERLCGPLHVGPNGLTGPMLAGPAARKGPDGPGLGEDPGHEWPWETDLLPLACLAFPDPHAGPYILGLEGQHVPDPKTSV